MWANRLVLFCVLTGCGALANGQIDVKDAVTTTTVIEVPKTTPSTTTTTTTTTPATTTTTTPATTTTQPPVTTTPQPPVTTTPKPTPFPSPEIGNWTTSCIKIQMAAQFNYTYVTKENKTATGIVNVSRNATIDDQTCLNQSQSIVLTWEDDENTRYLTLQFGLNGTTRFTLFTIHLKVHDNTSIADQVELFHYGNTFTTPLQMSYHCTREQKLSLKNSLHDTKDVGVLHLSNVQIEAFRKGNSTKFSVAKDCDAIDTPDIVPIAVGIALAALILVVLISYLVARNRNNARGYASF